MIRRILEFLGIAEPEEEVEERETTEEDLSRRRDLLERPPLPTSLVICRGMTAVRFGHELAEALKGGKMLILDLRGVDRESGQGLLDFLHGEALSARGALHRIAPGVFLALPNGVNAEEWEEEGDRP